MLVNKCAKNFLIKGLLSVAILGSAYVNAANQQSYTINLKADIPSDAFQIVPVDNGWINQTQIMGFDLNTMKLQTFEKQFQFKNTSGGIQATLTNTDSNGDAILSNGSDIIPLKVEFNGVQLTDTAQTVVDDVAAKAGGRTMLRISQADSQALTVNGSFTGQVAMIFEEAVAP